jgi:hypothetical protein
VLPGAGQLLSFGSLPNERPKQIFVGFDHLNLAGADGVHWFDSKGLAGAGHD